MSLHRQEEFEVKVFFRLLMMPLQVIVLQALEIKHNQTKSNWTQVNQTQWLLQTSTTHC